MCHIDLWVLTAITSSDCDHSHFCLLTAVYGLTILFSLTTTRREKVRREGGEVHRTCGRTDKNIRAHDLDRAAGETRCPGEVMVFGYEVSS